jgi:hypothetical protein
MQLNVRLIMFVGLIILAQMLIVLVLASVKI